MREILSGFHFAATHHSILNILLRLTLNKHLVGDRGQHYG